MAIFNSYFDITRPASQSQRQQIRVKRLTMKSCTTETHRKDFFFPGHYYSNIFQFTSNRNELHLYIFSNSGVTRSQPAVFHQLGFLPKCLAPRKSWLIRTCTDSLAPCNSIPKQQHSLWYRNKHIQKHHWLVVSTPLKNMKVRWDMLGWWNSQHMEK